MFINVDDKSANLLNNALVTYNNNPHSTVKKVNH